MPKTPGFVRIPEIVLRLLFTRQLQEKTCTHLGEIEFRQPATDVCQMCVELGDKWPSLRMCLICGIVGCCDTSKNKHMQQHIEQTGHSLIRSIEPGEGWIWCYPDSALISARSPQLDEPML